MSSIQRIAFPFNFYALRHTRTNSGRQIAVATKFYTAASNFVGPQIDRAARHRVWA